MRNPYQIAMYSERDIRTLAACDNSYVVKESKYKLVTEFRKWLLTKISKQSVKYDHSIKTALIEPDKIASRIWEQHGEHLRQRRDPKRVLIGAKDLSELMNGLDITEHIQIQTDYHKGRYGEIYGLTIEVIPWMCGVLVMP